MNQNNRSQATLANTPYAISIESLFFKLEILINYLIITNSYSKYDKIL